MRATGTELIATLGAIAAFALFFLPPGFLAGYALDVYGMRRRSRAEQVLWSLVLSVPLALLIAEGLGRRLPVWAVLAVFWLLAAGAAGLVAASRAGTRTKAPAATRVAMYAAAGLAAYVVVASLNIHAGARLFVPTLVNDWSVRLPMVAAAEQGRVPPLNPLSALSGAPAHLRYYYFWYVLCALPGRMLALSPHAVLSASSVWAGLALFAMALLCLRYLVGERLFTARRVALLLVAFLVIGLDVLHSIPDLFRSNPHPLPDIEWWRPDRTPGFLTTVLNSPHHLAGIVCCLVAILLVVEVCGAEEGRSGVVGAQGWPGLAGRALLAGSAFAACAGTSTFLVVIFLTVCVLLGLDLLRRRQWSGLGVLLASGAVAWALAHPYLRELRTGSSAAHGFASIALRSGEGAKGFFKAHHLLSAHPAVARAGRLVYVAVYTALELGFFFFVLLDRVRRELIPAIRSGTRLKPGQAALWVVLLGAGLNAMFLSSRLTQSDNDLGMHAAMVVRFVLVLWAVPFLDRILGRERVASGVWERGLRWAAVACLGLGLLGEAENLVLERFYFPMMEAHLLRGPMRALVADRLSYRLADMESAWQWVGAHAPAGARAQGNPGGLMDPAFALFSRRQLVAEDTGCGTAFGGDPNLCGPVVRGLRQLYGGFPAEERQAEVDHETPAPRPAEVTGAEGFEGTCARYGMDYVFVDETDPAWEKPGSWVWSLRPVYANSTVRVFGCGRP